MFCSTSQPIVRARNRTYWARVVWAVGVKRWLTYGSEIRRPRERRYPVRLIAAVTAAWFNLRYRDGPYVALKVPRRRAFRT